MKSILIVLVLSLFSFNLLAQGLTIEQLLHLIKQDVDVVNNYVTDRNWSYNSTIKDDGSGTVVIWNLKPNKYDSGKAQAWLEIKFFNDGNNWLNYQVHDKALFNKIKQKVLTYGMEKISSDAYENGISSTYMGKNYIIILGVTNAEGHYGRANANNVKIYPKDDYFKYIETF